ncbi:MAG TPA: RICIN domain-containing protein [Spirochaetota bacterium]|mgnify:CR=1 FL=1|nr:RICIN domain-containing protein [Spirochaetota bacterium]
MTVKRKAGVFLFSILFFSLLIFSEVKGAAAEFDTPPQNSFFYIKSVQSGNYNRGYWDQPGQKSRYKQGDNIAAWARDGRVDQMFTFKNAGGGWYYIISANGGYADVKGGKNGDGVSIQVWTPNNTASQKFRFKHMGNGRWKIYTAWNRAICLADRSDRNGSNIHTWGDHNGTWMEWYFEDSRTLARYIPASANSGVSGSTEIKGEFKAYTIEENGRKTAINPGVTDIEIWYFDRSDSKEPYKKKGAVKTNWKGEFTLGEAYKDYETIFLLSKSEDRASVFAPLYPKRGKTSLEGFSSNKYDSPDYLLVDTMYRGKQYYYEKDGYFYRENGIITNRQDFYFPDLTTVNRSNPAVKKLLSAIGGSTPARNDEEIAKKFSAVYLFFKTQTKDSMGTADSTVKAAADYMFRNCRKTSSSPVTRWPSFQEMADTYSTYGFIPVGNCTANSQVMATLLYMAGVPADKFFVAKFHYDMSWYVEHWIIAVNIGKRWYALDPQFKNVVNIKGAADFQKAYWERYIAKTYDYKKPFEAWLLPGSNIKAVPYLGDPEELRAIIAEKNKPMFFINNKRFKFSSGGMVFSSSGEAVVKRVSGSEVYLQVNAVSKQEGPRGMEEKKQSYEMKLTIKNGVYSSGEDYVYYGKVDSTGKTLNMSGEQSGMTFTVN